MGLLDRLLRRKKSLPERGAEAAQDVARRAGEAGADLADKARGVAAEVGEKAAEVADSISDRVRGDGEGDKDPADDRSESSSS